MDVIMVPETDHRFERELAEWFLRRGSAWSGTAGELLESLRIGADDPYPAAPLSSAGLYAHLQSHRQELQTLGVDIKLNNAVPRMISLRSLPNGTSQRKPSSNTVSIDRKPDDFIDLSSAITVRKIYSAHSGEIDFAGHETSCQEISPTRPESNTNSATDQAVGEDLPREAFLVNTGDALFAILEMRRQIRDQGLDLQAAVDLVIRHAQQISRCSGVAVGFLPEEIGSQFRCGSVSSRTDLAFDANLFQGNLLVGEAVPVSDARNHPALGAKYRREGVGSLIMMPIFRGQDVAGAMEFFFPEVRTFSAEDVMDLGLIAGVISESLGGSRNIGVRRALWDRRPPAKETSGNSAPQSGIKLPSHPEVSSVSELGCAKAGIAVEDILAESESVVPEVVLGTLATKLNNAPTQFWRTLKTAWTK